MSDQQPVLTEVSDGVMLITLNRPESLNAISAGLTAGLIAAMKQADQDDSVKAIVLTGAGRAFCAGVDLKEISGAGEGNVLDNDKEFVAAFANCRKPLIGAINGIVVTGGLEMAMCCDFLYASSTARFGDTHAKVGVMPTWGMSQRLSRLVGINRAREMSLSGQLIDVQTAFDWGMVNKICSPDSLLEETMEKAKQIAANRTSAVMGIRKLMNNGWATTLTEGLSFEDAWSRPHNNEVDFSEMNDRLSQVSKSNR
ncbi:putative enoyl-CoA hydratase echA8 [Zhongshania aliphaticivorans]|uniref:Putative enoyl-CoA hydratase echA8 n=1 Tax=Zhongshania aliphaticivorans TaxID=1470434 RepID=A0A5S9NRI4_9GAMM|nr:enoyl-CoA hydratase [Zhongshania aliphaticivorans]CAA0093152.1 putative enoyl-CoA hydratase echA8 [Zhongshania aliphaticivorans]CAA0110935.1 putative enoyl-CoA hydratase echA8 [Zhongshania aliphaticivorans]